MNNQRENIPGLNNAFGTEAPVDYAFKVAEAAAPPVVRRGRRINIGAAEKIPVGGKKIFDNGEISFGVFNIGGAFYALKNVCPHAGAPLCMGHIQTTHRPGEVGEFDPALEGRVLRCPWHGWEFDIVTGKGLYDRQGRVATYPCEVDEHGNVVVTL